MEVYEYEGKFYKSTEKIYQMVLKKSNFKEPTSQQLRDINNNKISGDGFLRVVAARKVDEYKNEATYSDGSKFLQHHVIKN